MKNGGIRTAGAVFLGFVLIWGTGRFVLPFFLPFFIGWVLAALVEPQIRFLQRRLHLPRWLASPVAVSCGLCLLSVVAVFLAGIGYRQASVLVQGLPRAMEALSRKSAVIRQGLLAAVAQAPPAVARLLEPVLRELFAGGSVLLEQAAGILLGAAGRVLGGLSGGALLAGTAVLSSYMISARYPELRSRVVESRLWRRWAEPVRIRLRRVFGSWLGAQAKLSSVTFALTAGGFLLIRAEQPLLWAAVTAVVDAVPMLGSGTVLIPMAVISLIWGSRIRALGLLGIWVTATVTRSVLEPRMVGRQMGLSPLAALVCLYVGFQLWGILGMILAPMLGMLAVQLRAE